MIQKSLFFFLICLTLAYYQVKAEKVESLMDLKNGLPAFYNEFNAIKLLTNIAEMFQINYINLYKEDTNITNPELFDSTILDLENEIFVFHSKVVYIENQFETYKRYKKFEHDYNNITLLEFSKIILNEEDGLIRVVEAVHKNVFSPNNSFFKTLFEFTTDRERNCHTALSWQQLFYNFLVATITLEFKANETVQYAFETKQKFEKSVPINKRNDITEAFARRIKKKVNIFKVYIKYSSQLIGRCYLTMNETDDVHEVEKKFTRLENVFQRVLYFASDFSKTQSQCPSKSNDFHDIKVNCSSQPCKYYQHECNRVVNCNEVDDKGAVNICFSKNQSTYRRYRYISSFSSGDYDDRCQYKWQKPFRTEFRLLRSNLVACNCICDEPVSSERYFSAGSATSDTHLNRVVTGVRFVKKNDTIHMQIKQGSLMRFGYVNGSTWKPIESETYVADYLETNQTTNFTVINLVEKNEKISLEYTKRRGIFLDDISLPKDYVLTGVRFSTAQEYNQTYLKIEVQSTPFDFLSGKLKDSESRWVSSAETTSERQFIDLSNSDAPEYINTVHRTYSKGPRYTYFTPTGLRTKSTGAMTVPYIDIRSSEVEPPMALSGISIDHLSFNNSGGFLTPVIRTYNVLPHIVSSS